MTQYFPNYIEEYIAKLAKKKQQASLSIAFARHPLPTLTKWIIPTW